jgi:ribosomal protein S18 acetylase RimI-like enzyme
MIPAGGRERAIAWRHAKQAEICDRTTPWAHGTVVLATDIPSFYDYNDVRLEGPDPGVTVAGLAAAVDELLGAAGLTHRQVEVEDEAAGVRLRRGFEALGWNAERLVWMELTGASHGATHAVAAAAAAVEITELRFERTRPLRESWLLTSGWMPTREAVRRFMELEERVATRAGARCLAAWDAAGALIGYVSFHAARGAAEIEQAYVDPGHRGVGIGGALIAAAVDAAGAPSTFIVADDEEDAKRLYARLGFEPVWIQHQFTRRGPGE